MKRRVITVGIIKNSQGQFLLCKMCADHGVYPGQWGLVGGGVESDETIDEAMAREIKEEVGLEVKSLKRLSFSDDQKTKIFRDGTQEEQYLIFLHFEVMAEGDITLNDEWSDYAWVDKEKLFEYDLNSKTRETFMGYRDIL